jgi:hypothetical protein
VIYSKRNDFLFIKGRKVAGTSVEMALSTICGPEDIISQITPIDEVARLKLGGRGAQNYSENPERERKYIERLASLTALELSDADAPIRKSGKHVYSGHMSLMDFVHAYGSLPTQRIFCVERSPYAKVISDANMRGNFERYKREGRKMHGDLERIKRVVEQMLGRGAIHPNIDLYRGEDGRVRTRVLRHESLAQDFAQLMTEYGISPVPDLPHAKQGADSNNIDPKTFFTRDQLDRINQIYAVEFDTFGYARL